VQKHLWLLVPAQELAHQENAAPAPVAFACDLLGLSEGACSQLKQ